MISEQSLTENKLLGPGEFGDTYDNGREELGLSSLQQAADEYLRDLGKSKMPNYLVLLYGCNCTRTLIGWLAVRNPPVNAHGHYRYFPPRFLFTKPDELSDFRWKKLR